MDPIEQRFQAMNWQYAEGDAVALRRLEGRIAERGRRRTVITYSDLVDGVPFDLPNLRESPRTINVKDWREIDRAIIGSFLGYISMRSYERAKFFASALVVGKDTHLPSKGFFDLIRDLEISGAAHDDDLMEIWLDHLQRAYEWYGSK